MTTNTKQCIDPKLAIITIILPVDYNKNFTTSFLTIWHMSTFMVKSIVIQVNGRVNGSIKKAESRNNG